MFSVSAKVRYSKTEISKFPNKNSNGGCGGLCVDLGGMCRVKCELKQELK